jgi:hypothetical protein
LPSHDVETVIVDVMARPAAGVISVTELEETQVQPRGWIKTDGNGES